jgi:cell division transport system ATP-binding protein
LTREEVDSVERPRLHLSEPPVSRENVATKIELDGLTKSYLGMLPVLDGVSCKIDEGEFYYLTGVSGAGKTTVFRLLMLIERPESGTIQFDGEDITRLTVAEQALHRRRIGMVFQDYRLLSADSIEENVALPLRVAGYRGARLRKKIERQLEQVGLVQRRRDPVAGLSGGEKQLVSIARALAFDPKVFFADEPTGNLDHTMAFRVMELIRNLHREGCTVIVATHDLTLIRAFRARTLLIKDRKLHEVRLAEQRASG